MESKETRTRCAPEEPATLLGVTAPAQHRVGTKTLPQTSPAKAETEPGSTERGSVSPSCRILCKKKAQRPLGGSWSPQLFPKCEGGGCNSGAACALAAMSTAQSRKRQLLLTRPILNSVQMEPFNDLDSCLVLFFPPCKRSLEIACCLGKHRRQHQRLGTGSSASPASSSPASLGSS